ncbi:MAG: acyltransferase family protein [Solirubrobacteraceae bacterium]|nr:acyltransferase family protein [Solirubrobacteraceae bacterium]
MRPQRADDPVVTEGTSGGGSAGKRPPAPAPVSPGGRSRLRPEIQALRALAVLTVVIYHVWPSAMPGGFIGVDVFFAISGFLITAHLLREVEATGRLALWRFWARRARRLLPAALLTLLVCAIGTLLLTPQAYWQQFLTEITASTAYIQNWHLAADAVDYLASENRPSPVQHFWSLSAEEQFYVLWPLLIVAAAWTATRRKRAAISATLVTVTGLSLLYSITETASNPAAAYFVTPTRAWEFGAGGLLALLGARAQLPDRSRALLSWAGLAAIMYAAIFYSTETPFPGSAALVPILGALAVMHAGMPQARWAPSRMLQIAPAQFLGGISYSVYLWHWPLLVFIPFVVIDPNPIAKGIAVVVLTVLAAWATKELVEDPVRRSTWLTAEPRVTFAVSGAATAIVAAVLAVGATHVQAHIQEAERESARVASNLPDCFGAAARDPEHPCENPDLRHEVVPLPVAAKTEDYAPCDGFHRDREISVCAFGVPRDEAKRTVALVGDSHASHWRAPMNEIARERGWRGLSITRTSCPFSTATKHTPEPTRSRCRRWVKDLPRYLRAHPEIDTLFVAGITGGTVNVPAGRTMFQAKVNGYLNAWRSLPDTIKHIVVIRDTPKIFADTVDCIERAIDAGERAGLRCAVPREAALEPDPQVVAARVANSPRMQVIDLNDVLCNERACFPVIGGVLVFKDAHHFTLIFAETLRQPLERVIRRATAGWGD